MKDESNSDTAAVTLDPPITKMEQPAEAPSPMDSTTTPVQPNPLQIVTGAPTFSDFVVVREKDDPSCEPIELPVSVEDNTLALQTLKTICSLATGLKYKNPASGAYRALLMDPTGAKFVPPAGGWDGKVFIVVAQQAQTSAPKPALPASGGLKKSSGGTDQNAKRRKLAVESDEDGIGGSANNHAAAASKQKRLNPSNDDEAANDGEGPLPPKQRSIEDDENDGKNGENTENSVDPENDNDDEGETGVETDSIVDAVHESKSPSGGNDNRFSDLIVLGIPFKMTESELRSYFEQFGKVALAEIKKKTTGGSKGFGFVRMETTEGQIRVLNKPIHTIGGRKCQVKVPLAKPGREPRENPLTQSKLFIGKLQEKTTNATLKHFFEAEARKLDPKCEILDLYIPRPFRGFAFATFTSPEVVKQLIRRGEFVVDGAPVTVSSATPKQMSDDRSARASPPMMHHGGGGRSQGGYGRSGGYGGPNYGPPPPLAQQQRGAPMPYGGGGPYGGSGGPPSWAGGNGGPPPLSYGSGIGTHHAWGGFGGGGAGPDGGPQRYAPLPSSHPPPFSQFGGGGGQKRPDPLFAVGGKPPSNAPPTAGGFPPGTGAAGNPMALGLETLNLNNMKPEVMTEAWKAFVRVAAEASGGAGGNIGDGRPSTGGYGGGGVGGGAPSPFSNESTLKSYGQQMASMHQQQPPQSHHRPAGGGGSRGGPSNTGGSGGAGGGASSMNWR